MFNPLTCLFILFSDQHADIPTDSVDDFQNLLPSDVFIDSSVKPRSSRFSEKIAPNLSNLNNALSNAGKEPSFHILHATYLLTYRGRGFQWLSMSMIKQHGIKRYSLQGTQFSITVAKSSHTGSARTHVGCSIRSGHLPWPPCRLRQKPPRPFHFFFFFGP